MTDLEQLAIDMASFNSVNPAHAIEALQASLVVTFDHLRFYGVAYSDRDFNKALRDYAKVYNRGRARRVSLKRPSPQLSGAALTRIEYEIRTNLIQSVRDQMDGKHERRITRIQL
ncbi:MAG: hypothetical protein GY938_27040 [Ketobacter sp.]|nr:hypothetical protein [Ketobacter sp.]